MKEKYVIDLSQQDAKLLMLIMWTMVQDCRSRGVPVEAEITMLDTGSAGLAITIGPLPDSSTPPQDDT